MKILKINSSDGGLGKSDGSEEAPDIILDRINDIFLNESGKKLNFEVGQVKVVKNNLEETNKNIFDRAKNFDFFIGGDHSITYPCFKAFSEKFKNSFLVIFDAHPDCEVYTDIVTHEDFLRKLIDDNILKKENLILIGLRSWSENEYNFLKENKIKYFDMKKIFDLGVKEVCDVVMENCCDNEGVYLSVDIDVVDPSFAPGTGYVEPGGLSSRELFYFIQRFKMMKNLKVVDLVEIIPKKDFEGKTVKLGAKIISELI